MRQSQEPSGIREGRFGVLTVLLSPPALVGSRRLRQSHEQEAKTIPWTLNNKKKHRKYPQNVAQQVGSMSEGIY